MEKREIPPPKPFYLKIAEEVKDMEKPSDAGIIDGNLVKSYKRYEALCAFASVGSKQEEN